MITIPGKIQGKGRPRFYGHHAVTPEATVNYEAKIAEAYKAGMHYKDNSWDSLEVYHEGPVRVSIIVNFAIPTSYSKKKTNMCKNGEIKPNKKPDVDNIAKAVLDALNGVAYKDDTQVVELSVVKTWSYREENLSIFVDDVKPPKEATDESSEAS